MLLLFTCPCLLHRNLRYASKYKRWSVMLLLDAGMFVGVVYFLVGIAILFVGILAAVHAGAYFVDYFLFSWAITYVLNVLLDLIFIFNCTPCCVALRNNNCSAILFCGLPQLLCLSQWQIEKNIVMKALRADQASQINKNGNLKDPLDTKEDALFLKPNKVAPAIDSTNDSNLELGYCKIEKDKGNNIGEKSNQISQPELVNKDEQMQKQVKVYQSGFKNNSKVAPAPV